ncbi:MAG: DUF4012 domain-containing protein, partial [bacterium]|nr:DUF4012 domain-containing protein [bacterium]
MAKTKRTIQKIIWDTERGVGVAREYTPRTPLFSSNGIEKATEPETTASKQLTRIPDIVRDHEKFSPHVLDLRHMHTAQTAIPVSRPSFVNRFFASLKKQRVSRDSVVAPFSNVSFLRLPAIHAKDIERHFSASRREHGEGVWRAFTPAILIYKYPLIAQLSIGTPLLILAHLFSFTRPFFSFFIAGFFSLVRLFIRPLQPFRIVIGTLRYYFRRVRLEWESFSFASPLVSVVPVVISPTPLVPLRVTRRRTLSVFIILAIVLSIPFHAFSSYQPLIDVRNVQQKGTALFAHVDQAVSLMKRGEWQDARSEWEAFKQGSEDLGASVYLTNPLIGRVGSFFSSRVRTGRAVIETAIAFADAGSAAATMGEIVSTDRTLTDRLVRIEPFFRDLVNALDRIDMSLPRIDMTYLPAELQSNFTRVPVLLNEVKSTVRRVQGIVTLLPALLGHDHSMRYLVLFQNDAEARPTGGFIGSIGIVDIEQGKVRTIYMPT